MVADPVRGVDYPATYQQLLRWFPDNAACLEYLGRLRWEDGFVCPACGGERFWRTGAGLWMCRACQRRTSVTAGTIFHRTRTPMSTWFAAIWFVTSQKNGMSAQGAAAGPRVRLVRDGVGVAAQAPPGDGAPGPGSAVRDRRGRRDDGRRSQPRHVRGRYRQGPGDDRGGTQRRSPSGPGPARRRRPAGQPRPGRLGRRGDRTRLHHQDGRRTGATPTRRPRLHPPGHRRLQRRRPVLGAARRAPGRLPAQTLADRHPALPGRAAAPALLPRRVHLPLQPAHRTPAAACCSTGSFSKP